MRASLTFAFTVALLSGSAGGTPALPDDKVIASIDLSKAFATRSPWRFTATQGPDIPDPTAVEQGPAPGRISLCVNSRARPCLAALAQVLRVNGEDDLFSEPHFLYNASIVHADGASRAPLLFLRFASVYSGDSDQRVATVMLAYDRATDSFRRAFSHVTGHNNNQEVRYLARGPLRGAVIVAEPTDDRPFGFSVSVHRLTPASTYRQVLRYRSATRYGDGNPLAVIDSEMPNIQQRLGLWRPGKPLPLPASGCARPRLVRTALWCS